MHNGSTNPDELYDTTGTKVYKNAYSSRNTAESELYLTLPIYWGYIQFKMVKNSSTYLNLYIRLRWWAYSGADWTSWKQIY